MSCTRPDFFIAGAPKCGTTALFEYLSRHPLVFMPRLKEPNFFCADLRMAGRVGSLEEYERLFADAPEGAVTGEASAMYLFSDVAIARIMDRNPRAKVIVMLRHPVDAAHSLHSSRWAHGHESVPSFERAWYLQAERLAGASLPPAWPDPLTLQYGAIYRYAPQLRRLLQHVPQPQRHIVTYEDFFADPVWRYAELLRFLGLESQRSEFAIVNPSIGPKSSALDRWLREPPRWLETMYAPLRPLVRSAGLRPARMLRRLNSRPAPKDVLRPQFRLQLEGYFADDIAEAEALLGRRLWCESSSSMASGRTLET